MAYLFDGYVCIQDQDELIEKYEKYLILKYRPDWNNQL